jgi:hypothetical protein
MLSSCRRSHPLNEALLLFFCLFLSLPYDGIQSAFWVIYLLGQQRKLAHKLTRVLRQFVIFAKAVIDIARRVLTCVTWGAVVCVKQGAEPVEPEGIGLSEKQFQWLPHLPNIYFYIFIASCPLYELCL